MNKQLVSRRFWHYVEYEDFVQGICANTPPSQSFEAWVRPAVIDEARKLYAETVNQKDPDKGVELLSRLTSDRRMKTV